MRASGQHLTSPFPQKFYRIMHNCTSQVSGHNSEPTELDVEGIMAFCMGCTNASKSESETSQVHGQTKGPVIFSPNYGGWAISCRTAYINSHSNHGIQTYHSGRIVQTPDSDKPLVPGKIDPTQSKDLAVVTTNIHSQAVVVPCEYMCVSFYFPFFKKSA